MPEKWLIDMFSSRAFHGVGAKSIRQIRRTDLYRSLTAIFDLSSVVAFLLLCHRWTEDRLPLAIGYTITFMSAIAFFIANGWGFMAFAVLLTTCAVCAFSVLFCCDIVTTREVLSWHPTF